MPKNKIKLYNSLTRQKEKFIPINENHVKMYVCGPTVYNYAHIGNARATVVFDQWVRLLRHTYPKVTYVSNITDVEDKIITAAQEAGLPINDITEKYTRIYNEDMASLGANAPDIQPKATEYIDEMIELNQTLIEKEYAYEAEGHVLFHVPSNKSQAHGLRLRLTNVTLRILFCGNQAIKTNQGGIVHGAVVDLVGTLNVRPWRKKHLVCPLIFMVVAQI